MNGKKGKIVALVGIIVAIIAVVMLFNSGLEHIEDTNGVENFELQTITDDNIVNQDTGAMGVSVKTNSISNMTEISSKKFTGVYEVLYSNLIGKSDFLLNIYDLKINSGNFKMVVVHDGEIVHTITPENAEEFLLEDINGTVSLVVAGESADFSFKISDFDYEQFSHK